jgi:hypothetical protein
MRKATKWLAFLVIMTMVMTFILAGAVTAHAFWWRPPREEETTVEEPETPAEETETTTTVEEPAERTGGVIEALIWDDARSPDGQYTPDDLIDGLTVQLYRLENKVQLSDDATDYTFKDPNSSGLWNGDWVLYDSKVSGPGGFILGSDAMFEYLHGWVGWNNLPLDQWDPTWYKLVLVDDGTFDPLAGIERFASLSWNNWHNIQFFPMREEYSPPFEIGSTTGTISGTVWSDANADLIREFPEKTLEGWTLLLTNRYGSRIATAKTDRYGFYYFRGLKPGTYNVWVDGQRNWKQVAPYYKLCTWPPWGYEKGHYTISAKAGVYHQNNDFGFLDMKDSTWALLYYGLWWVGLLQYQFTR